MSSCLLIGEHMPSEENQSHGTNYLLLGINCDT